MGDPRSVIGDGNTQSPLAHRPSLIAYRQSLIAASF
jgi:hypothetical protein